MISTEPTEGRERASSIAAELAGDLERVGAAAALAGKSLPIARLQAVC